MGNRGPVNVPIPILEARGSWRGRVARLHAPVPPPGRPSCPSWLDKEAKRAWRKLLPELERMGLLARADGQAFARYCQLWSRWVKAEQHLQRYGETYPVKDEAGRVRCFLPWPQVSIANKLNIALCRLEQEFGLTPAGRARLGTTQRWSSPEPSDLLDALIDAGGPTPRKRLAGGPDERGSKKPGTTAMPSTSRGLAKPKG